MIIERAQRAVVWGAGRLKIPLLVLYLLPGGWANQVKKYPDQLRRVPRTSWADKIFRGRMNPDS